MTELEYLQNLLDTVTSNIAAGNLKPDGINYRAACDCISCRAYTEIIRLCEEIAANVPDCYFDVEEIPHVTR